MRGFGSQSSARVSSRREREEIYFSKRATFEFKEVFRKLATAVNSCLSWSKRAAAVGIAIQSPGLSVRRALCGFRRCPSHWDCAPFGSRTNVEIPPVGRKRQRLKQLLIRLHRVGSRRLRLIHSAQIEWVRECDRLAGRSHGHECPRSFDERFPWGMHSRHRAEPLWPPPLVASDGGAGRARHQSAP